MTGAVCLDRILLSAKKSTTLLGYRETGLISLSMKSDPAPVRSRNWDMMIATFYTATVSELRRISQRNALQLSTITAILALFASHHPLSAFDVEVNALIRIAALHIIDSFLCVVFLNEVSHKRLIPNGTPLRS